MIYLDYNATSPIRPEVKEGVAPFLKEHFGNPSSVHQAGRDARACIESVRGDLLVAFGDAKGRLVFTSGGTEADNLALKGAARALFPKKDHVVVSAIEHHAILHAAESLTKEGIRLTVVPVDREGLVDPVQVRKALDDKTALVSVMHANNEIGTIQPIEEIAQAAHSHGALFHTDAVQAFGKIPFNVKDLGVDLASISGHKLGGLKGAGALYLRSGIPLKAILNGGPHEQELRAGTENVLGIVALGAALQANLRDQRQGVLDRIRALRDRLEQGIKERVPETYRNGDAAQALPGTLNMSFVGCDGETLLMALDLAGICVSTGSACSSGSMRPSHVLVAMGLSRERLQGSIRFSVGWATTEEEIEESLRIIPPIVERVRKSNVIASAAKQSQ